jgi:hypothetical protein
MISEGEEEEREKNGRRGLEDTRGGGESAVNGQSVQLNSENRAFNGDLNNTFLT